MEESVPEPVQDTVAERPGTQSATDPTHAISAETEEEESQTVQPEQILTLQPPSEEFPAELSDTEQQEAQSTRKSKPPSEEFPAELSDTEHQEDMPTTQFYQEPCHPITVKTKHSRGNKATAIGFTYDTSDQLIIGDKTTITQSLTLPTEKDDDSPSKSLVTEIFPIQGEKGNLREPLPSTPAILLESNSNKTKDPGKNEKSNHPAENLKDVSSLPYPDLTNGRVAVGSLPCQSNHLGNPTNLFTHRNSDGDKVKTAETIINATAQLREETRDFGGYKARDKGVILSISDMLGDEKNKLGHNSPLEHISHLQSTMEPRGLAQQDNLSANACTILLKKVGTLELFQDLPSTMISLLSLGTLQPSLTLTPVETAGLPTSSLDMTQCEVCDKTIVPSEDLQKHRLEHELVQNTECKTDLIDNFPPGSNQARPTPPLPTLLPNPATPLSEDNACETGDETAPNKYDFKKHMVTHNRFRPSVCEICKETIHHDSGLQIHLKEHMTRLVRVKAEEQIQEFASSTYLISVQATCEVCNETFCHNNSLEKHIYRHHQNKSELFLKSILQTIPVTAPQCDQPTSKGGLATTIEKETQLFFLDESEVGSTIDKPNISFNLTKPGPVDKILPPSAQTLERGKVYQASMAELNVDNLVSNSTTGARDPSLMQIKPDACGTCANGPIRVTDLTTHMKIHNRNESFQCESCARSSHWDTDPGTHKHTHASIDPSNCTTGVHGKDELKFDDEEMAVEDEESSRADSFPPHATIHHTESEESRETFTNTNIMMKQESLKKKCEVCGNTLAHVNNLERHKLTHKKKEPASDRMVELNFKLHPSMNSDNDPAPSPANTWISCNFSAHNSNCAVCGYSTTIKKPLAKHDRPHNKKEPFACADCGKKWTHKTCWKVHIRTGHKETICIIQSTITGFEGVSRSTLFHLLSMPYTPIKGGEGWLIPRPLTKSPCWKTNPHIDVPINDTPRLSQEEELVQDYRSGTTIVMVEEHHHTGLFPTDHRHHSRIRSVLVCTLVDVNITNSTKNDSYPVTHPPGHRYLITVKKHNVKNTEVCVKEFKYRPKLNNSQETNQEPMLSAVIRPIIEVLKVTSMLLMQLKKSRVFELTKLSISLRSCI